MSHPNPRFDPENSYPSDDYRPSGKKIHKQGGGLVGKLKRMIAEPASKEWFKKYGSPSKSKALDNRKK